MATPLIDEDTIIAAVPSFADVDASERTRRILAASAAVEGYVGRPLAQATFTETHRPESTRTIWLRVTPIVSISSITYGRDATALVPDDDYSILNAETGAVELYRSFGGGYRYPDRTYGGDPRAGGLQVTYVGGYALADVPADIQDAVIHAVLAKGTTVGQSGGGMFASEQLGEYSYRRESSSVTGSAVSMGLPDSVTGPLRRYRRARFS